MRASSQDKKKGHAECISTQRDLFDHSVSDHVAARKSLCCITLVESKSSTMDAQPKPTYSQNWREYTAAQVHEKAKLLELLYALCEQIEEPIQHMGRPRIPLADRIFASVYKVYSTLSGRRFMSDLMEAKRRGYMSKMPNFCFISRSLESEELTPYLKQLIIESSLALKSVESDFAVDSSGFATGQFSRWFDAKYGANMKQHDWIKVHLMCGVKTNIVTSVEVSGPHANDSPYLKPLLETTSKGFQVKELSADKGYDSFNNRCLVLIKGGHPFIPFREGEKNKPNLKYKGELWKRFYHFYKFNEAVFKQHYHKRSNVETVFHMIKSKFGERLRSKTLIAQTNEVLCKVLCHNLCCVVQSIYELGIEPTFASENTGDANVL